MIILNSALLALYDYSDRDSLKVHNQTLDSLAYILTIIFLVEATIKILAMGFCVHKYAYLRDSWNLMDFSIVVMG
jgi:Ion transport protein